MRFSIRQIFIFVFAFAILFAILPYALSLYSFVRNPLAGFVGKTEFESLTGRQAKRKLHNWPSAIAAADVQLVSFKHQWSRDSYSVWYRIKLAPEIGELWQDHIHKGRRPINRDWSDDFYERFEGVDRIIRGPPPLQFQTGDTPVWWAPPTSEFRATELMIWHYDSGSGQASYSSFDETKGELWIYEYSSQYDILWSFGDVPDGDVFSNIEQDVDQD